MNRFLRATMPAAVTASLILLIALVSFVPKAPQVQKNAAIVSQMSGIYVFIKSQPTAPYEVMGTVKKTGVSWTGGSKEIVNIQLKRAQKDYPGCEGIIFDDIDLEHATVIKFK